MADTSRATTSPLATCATPESTSWTFSYTRRPLGPEFETPVKSWKKRKMHHENENEHRVCYKKTTVGMTQQRFMSLMSLASTSLEPAVMPMANGHVMSSRQIAHGWWSIK